MRAEARTPIDRPVCISDRRAGFSRHEIGDYPIQRAGCFPTDACIDIPIFPLNFSA
jgi:hypothetical protein